MQESDLQPQQSVVKLTVDQLRSPKEGQELRNSGELQRPSSR